MTGSDLHGCGQVGVISIIVAAGPGIADRSDLNAADVLGAPSRGGAAPRCLKVHAPCVSGNGRVVARCPGAGCLAREDVARGRHTDRVRRCRRHFGQGVDSRAAGGAGVCSSTGAQGRDGCTADRQSEGIDHPPADDLAGTGDVDVVNARGHGIEVGRAVDVGQIVPRVVKACPAHVQMMIQRGGLVTVSVSHDSMPPHTSCDAKKHGVAGVKVRVDHAVQAVAYV